MTQRRTAAAIAGAVLLAACGSTDTGEPGAGATNPAEAAGSSDAPDSSETAGSSEADDQPSGAAPFEVDQIESSAANPVASGLQAYRNREVPPGIPAPLVDFDEIRSGGPPPDGIPPIDTPKFLTVAATDYLTDNEPVLALEIDGEARAYPVQVLTWHEIVNDTIAGIPVTVSYCPLCNSAIAYDRRVGELILDFGTSGLLYNSALVMYDRQTQTLWSHFTGEGIIGELTGEDLTAFPLSTVAWSTFRDNHPDGLVLSRETGFSRDYGRNPYPGYDDVNGVPFLFQGEVDGRYTALTRMVGIESGDEAVGIPLEDLRTAEVIAGEIGGESLIALWAAGTSSALESSSIADGVDVGATGVFVPVANGQELTFTAVGDGTFTDDQTGSTWNILGEAVDGELSGTQLDSYVHVDTFWFAWSTFRADTELLTG